MNDDTPTNNALRLKTLLKEAGYTSTRFDATRRLLIFAGRTRDWTFSAALANGWISLVTYVCEIPEPAGVRTDLFEVAMTANHAMSLTKFVKSNGLVMELEYRDEHLTGEVLRNLIGLALTNLEEWYPKLFRVVSGDAALASLADAATIASPNAR